MSENNNMLDQMMDHKEMEKKIKKTADIKQYRKDYRKNNMDKIKKYEKKCKRWKKDIICPTCSLKYKASAKVQHEKTKRHKVGIKLKSITKSFDDIIKLF